jgi:hypothetical protein
MAAIPSASARQPGPRIGPREAVLCARERDVWQPALFLEADVADRNAFLEELLGE